MGIFEGIWNSTAGMGLEMGGQKWAMKQQLKQQEKLQALQMQGQKEMGKYNQGLALDLWDKTNYSAQRKQMEKAGLNVGLMYGMGGGGGATASTPTGNVTGATANPQSPTGTGIQIGMGIQRQQAEIENIKANTEKTKADTKKSGEETSNVEASTKNILQTTENLKVQKAILEYDKRIREIQANVEGRTEDEQVELTKEALKKLKGEAVQAQTAGEISVETKDDVIEQADLANKKTEQDIKSGKATEAGTKATTEKTKQETLNLIQDELFKKFQNKLAEMGITTSDSPILRQLAIQAKEKGITIEDIVEAEEGTWEKIKEWIKKHTPYSPNKKGEKWNW